jgi:hypothetical protein
VSMKGIMCPRMHAWFEDDLSVAMGVYYLLTELPFFHTSYLKPVIGKQIKFFNLMHGICNIKFVNIISERNLHPLFVLWL